MFKGVKFWSSKRIFVSQTTKIWTTLGHNGQIRNGFLSTTENKKRLGTEYFAIITNVNYEGMSPFSLWLLDDNEFHWVSFNWSGNFFTISILPLIVSILIFETQRWKPSKVPSIRWPAIMPTPSKNQFNKRTIPLGKPHVVHKFKQ